MDGSCKSAIEKITSVHMLVLYDGQMEWCTIKRTKSAAYGRDTGKSSVQRSVRTLTFISEEYFIDSVWWTDSYRYRYESGKFQLG